MTLFLWCWTTSNPVFHRAARFNNNRDTYATVIYNTPTLLHFNSLDLIRMMKEDLLNKRTEFKGSN